MPQHDPYAELGVARDAPAAAVRRAYRSRAKATHPDHGGNAAAFARTKRASVVLLDPAKRARFDETGIIDDEAPDNALSEALVALSQLLDSVMVQCEQQQRDPATADVLDMMSRTAEQAKAAMLTQKRGIAAHLARSEKLRGRFKVRKGREGGNRMVALLDERIAAQQRTIAKIEHEAATLDRAIAMMADYSFDRDATAPARPQSAGMGMWDLLRVGP